MDTQQVARRIEARLGALGFSERQACLRAGLRVDAIRNIRRGRSPRFSTLQALARILDVPLTGLVEGDTDLPEVQAALQAQAPGLAPAHRTRAPSIPLRSRAAGFGVSFTLVPVEQAAESIPPGIQMRRGRKPFAVIVPRGAPPPLKFGDLAICDPDQLCSDGDLVLAERRDATYLVGILLRASETGALLETAAGVVETAAAELRRLHRVAELRLH
jgi:transcriptional regulator with XRE-family HTH domain